MSACFLCKTGINRVLGGNDNEEVLCMIYRILLVCVIVVAIGCFVYWGYLPESEGPILRATAV